MSWLSRLFKRNSEAPGPDEQTTTPSRRDFDQPDQEAAPAQFETSSASQQLNQFLKTLDQEPQKASEIDPHQIMELISQIEAQGDRNELVDVLKRMSQRMPQFTQLRFRLAEILYDLKLFHQALGLLEGLLEDPLYRVQAHFMLGDYYFRQRDTEAALRHFEAVLALDFTFPRARGRVRELKSRLDRPLATVAPTILGAEDLGPGSRFILHKELGRGGGGTVYLAQDKTLNRPVAVKVIHPHVAQRQEAWAHLFCEARIAAALQHPHIVTIYDLDESLSLVVMEYCSGGALADRIAEAPFALELALRRLSEVASVLDTVHRCGVVHRDLKPANLLFRTSEKGGKAPLVLTDFGIAHAGLSEETELDGAGSLVYMAPEQRRGAAADPRVDLYACGVVLLEMILGRRPLDTEQALRGEIILEISDLWLEIREQAPTFLSTQLVDFCRSLVDPAPEHRPDQASAVSTIARELAEACEQDLRRKDLLEELKRRAGPPPWSDAVKLWLDDQTRTLGC